MPTTLACRQEVSVNHEEKGEKATTEPKEGASSDLQASKDARTDGVQQVNYGSARAWSAASDGIRDSGARQEQGTRQQQPDHVSSWRTS